jgi:hypothetical protein
VCFPCCQKKGPPKPVYSKLPVTIFSFLHPSRQIQSSTSQRLRVAPAAITSTAAPHDTGLIPMAQSPTRGGRVGTFSPTNNGRIDQKPQPDSRPPRLAMSPVPTAVWQHRSDQRARSQRSCPSRVFSASSERSQTGWRVGLVAGCACRLAASSG